MHSPLAGVVLSPGKGRQHILPSVCGLRAPPFHTPASTRPEVESNASFRPPLHGTPVDQLTGLSVPHRRSRLALASSHRRARWQPLHWLLSPLASQSTGGSGAGPVVGALPVLNRRFLVLRPPISLFQVR